MSDTTLDFEDAAIVQPAPAKPSTRKPPAKKKAKIGGVALSFIIATILFVICVIVSVVPFEVDGTMTEGGLDYLITDFFRNLPELDALGAFMKPDITSRQFLEGNFGQLPSYVLLVIVVILLIWSWIQIGKEQKLAKAENRAPRIVKMERFYKYCWLIALAGLIVAFGVVRLLKEFYGRPRPGAVSAILDFFPFFLPSGNLSGINTESFMSGHTAQAALMCGLPLALVGSRKKALAPVVGILCALYVVLMGMGRMASNDHWFSDTVFAGYSVYACLIFTYYAWLDIPGQERIYRYRLVNDPFNDGYAMLLQAKSMLKESPDAAMEKVAAGLQLVGQAREKVEELSKYGYDHAELAARIDDVSRRFGALLQEYHGKVKGSPAAMDTYIKQWSYVC